MRILLIVKVLDYFILLQANLIIRLHRRCNPILLIRQPFRDSLRPPFLLEFRQAIFKILNPLLILLFSAEFLQFQIFIFPLQLLDPLLVLLTAIIEILAASLADGRFDLTGLENFLDLLRVGSNFRDVRPGFLRVFGDGNIGVFAGKS